MVKRLAAVDEARIEAAIRAVETTTRAEIVCVLSRAASSYEFFPLVWAALVSLATPSVLLLLTLWSAESIYLIQLVLFLVTLGLLSRPGVRMRLVPRALQRRRAHRAATEQFLLRGLSRKAERTGVLIYVAEAERYARIIADEGVSSVVPASRWAEAVGVLVAEARQGRVDEGYCQAVALCGRILAEALPSRAEGAVDELSNRFVVV